MAEALVIRGYPELMRAFAVAADDSHKTVTGETKRAGEAIRGAAAARIAPKDLRTAGGYRVIVRQSAVVVEQSLGRTTGVHPEWGAYQMVNALLPAAAQQGEETDRRVEASLDRMAERFNSEGLL